MNATDEHGQLPVLGDTDSFWRMTMQSQYITLIFIQTHESPSPWSIHVEELLILLLEGRKSVRFDLTALRTDLCPFHPFYAIRLVSFKSFMLALHIYLQPHNKINTFSLKFIYLMRYSTGDNFQWEQWKIGN